ncbi:hypothetical protein VP01_574g7 [Puccinia sorghi]|uniref:Uncharacterized protein n=1 Tax=Puccinia sorghi TaxID=27349 RepID=A0A0L6UJ69_9BASI|nr:hypothetical protein VP01_574g7 [Puccinia sorghi]
MRFSLFILILVTSQRKFGHYAGFSFHAGDVDQRHFHLAITILAKALGNSGAVVSGHPVSTQMLHTSTKFSHVPSSKKKIWRPSSTQKKKPTRVIKSRNLPSHDSPESHTSHKHTRRADWYKQDRIYAALIECLSGIQKRVRIMKEIPSEGVTSENAEKIAWNFLKELKEILNVIKNCIERIKNGDFPLPSSKPGFMAHATLVSPRCIHPPAMGIDICKVIADILTEMRLCFQEISDLAMKFPIIQNICGDTLTQISGALANLIIASSGRLGNIIRLIARIFESTPSFFKNIGFGFGNIPGIIAGSGFRDFNRFL